MHISIPQDLRNEAKVINLQDAIRKNSRIRKKPASASKHDRPQISGEVSVSEQERSQISWEASASKHERPQIFEEACVKLLEVYKKMEEENRRLTSDLATVAKVLPSKDVALYQSGSCHQLHGFASAQENNALLDMEAEKLVGTLDDGSSLTEVSNYCQRRAEAAKKLLDKMALEADSVERRVLPSIGQDRAKGGKRIFSSSNLFSPQAKAAKKCGTETRVNTDISDKALSEVSNYIGQEWQQIAIESLNLKRYQLHEIEEDNKKFREKVFAMFEMWRKQNVGQASARILFEKLNQRKDVEREALLTLQKYS